MRVHKVRARGNGRPRHVQVLQSRRTSLRVVLTVPQRTRRAVPLLAHPALDEEEPCLARQ